jgi:hypothetical protein
VISPSIVVLRILGDEYIGVGGVGIGNRLFNAIYLPWWLAG